MSAPPTGTRNPLGLPIPRWEAPPGDVVADPDTTHVWRIPLAAAAGPDVDRVLSADERRRAGRLRRPSHRHRFTAAHVALRRILGRYLHLPPQELQFGRRPLGKPFLVAPDHRPVPQFNLSHADDWALCAVSGAHEIGVDVECLERQADIDAIAARFFAPAEQAWLCARTPTERRDAFYLCWTCKEAYLKAVGEGLHRPLHEVVITVSDDASATVRVAGVPDAARWTLLPFLAAPGHAAALAVAHPRPGVRFWETTP